MSRTPVHSIPPSGAAGALVILILLGTSACGAGDSPEQEAAQSLPSHEDTQASSVRLFRDLTDETGLDFQHYSGATGQYHVPEIIGSGVALLDYDDDGDLDVFFVQSNDYFRDGSGNGKALYPFPASQAGGHRLFANRLIPDGALSFTDVTEQVGLVGESYGMGVAVADFDNDGDPDIYVTNYNDNALYRNDGGVFKKMADAAGAADSRWSTSASFCDVNNDGWLDLYVANYVRYSPDDKTICRDSLGQQDYCGPQSYAGITDALFLNNGAGGFVDRSKEWSVNTRASTGLGVVCRDLNQDGTADVYVANDAEPNLLWLNRNHQTFEEQGQLTGVAINVNGMSEGSMGIAAGDFDRDGDDDLFITHWDNETNTLYRNDLKLGFLDVTNRANLATPSLAHTGFGTEWLDIDNDGHLDLFVANGAVQRYIDRSGKLSDGYGQRNQVFLNTDTGRFFDAAEEAGDATRPAHTGRGAAFGDIDNDGDVDVVISNKDARARLYINEAGQERAWLGVSFASRSSGDALGAVVSLELPSGVVLRRVVRTDGSYMSASDPRVVFGLDDATQPQSVRVQWPGGDVQVFSDLAVNHYHVLTRRP